MIQLNLQSFRNKYHKDLFDLMHEAHSVHRQHHNIRDIQKASLLSIKTGACPEDCKYCPQSAHYKAVEKEPLLDVDYVLAQARRAKENGSSRFCMGAAWRSPPKKGDQFNKVLKMVSGVKAMGMEACVTLGMLDQEQAQQLKDAGLTAYNHNLDSSESFYKEIITTRTYQDRLDTIKNVSAAGIEVCSGGIIGMGETIDDRLEMLLTLAKLEPMPSSVPINVLVPVKGTPLEHAKPVHPFELIRLCALARIAMPKCRVRLSAGRISLSDEAQAMCFYVGANSIFYGEELLTTPNNDDNRDNELLAEIFTGVNGEEEQKIA